MRAGSMVQAVVQPAGVCVWTVCRNGSFRDVNSAARTFERLSMFTRSCRKEAER